MKIEGMKYVARVYVRKMKNNLKHIFTLDYCNINTTKIKSCKTKQPVLLLNKIIGGSVSIKSIFFSESAISQSKGK